MADFGTSEVEILQTPGVPLLPLEEAARDLGVSRRTLNRLIAAGKVKRWRRTGDRRSFVDVAEARRALGWREG